MPFKFRLRRARHYNVSTKNSYVVCVHLLDKTLKECTLSADSLGQECIDNIAQRIELTNTTYYGLRFMNKKLQYRWVELDKPLRRQLEKYAYSPMLYFGIMFYAAGTACLTDDSVRYQYYLQLKTDVIDGKLPCTEEQAVRLASCSIQAEIGDHDAAQHTPDFVKDLVLLPKNMASDEAMLSRLTSRVVSAHRQLTGYTAAAAELQYIVEAQQLHGYGLEYYPAKDESGNELLLGTSFVGIFVFNNSQPAQYFKWSDINNVIHNKRVLGIETSLAEQAINYTMESPDMAKYVYKMCNLQHQFYRENKHLLEPDKNLTEGSTGPLPDLQQTVALAMASEATSEQDTSHHRTNRGPSLQQSQLPETGQTVISSQEFYNQAHSQQQRQQLQLFNEQQQQQHQQQPPDVHYANGTVYPVSQTPQPPDIQFQASTPNSQNVYQNTQQQQQQQQPQQSVGGFPSPAPASRLAPVQLPSYRPSPDYEAVMRSRMAQHNLEQVNNVANISHAQVYANPEMMAYSQPEMGYTQYLQQDRAYSVYGGMGDHPALHHHHVQYRPVDRSSSLIIHPTYSTPELNSQGLSNQFSTSENLMSEALLAQYKPPPPYPRPSSSTPDLATQTRRAPVSSSPDLVSRRNLSNAPLVEQSRLDQSMENLVFESQKLQIRGHSPGGMTSQPGEAVVNPGVSAVMSDLTVDQQVQGSQGDLRTPMMDQLLSGRHPNELGIYANSSGPGGPVATENIYVNTAGSGDYANVSAIIASESGANQHYLHYNEQLGVQPYPTNLSTATTNAGYSTQHQMAPHHVPSIASGGSDRSDFSNRNSAQDSSFEHGDMAHAPTVDTVDGSCSRAGPGVPGFISHHHTSSLDSSISHDSRMFAQDSETEDEKSGKRLSMGPLKMAAMNGLSISRASVLDPTPYENRAPKDERRKTLETKLEEGQVFQEFEQIPKKAAKCECTQAASQENRDRNRFKDVHPYDHNRVRLNSSKENPNGYINASHIKMTVKADTWRYIAAQGPLAATVRDFWAMVWEQNVDVIAMLTAVVEQGRPKCYQYWPEKQGLKHKAKYGEWEVYLKFSNDSGGYVTRGLQVRHVTTGTERLVWQLQYTDWPDHGCPQNTDGFLTYMDEIESVHRHVMSEKQAQNPDVATSPILVHCSAGVGRSGVVILADIMKTCLEHNVNVDVATVLGHLRAQRMHMVQTVSQYSFVYKVLVHFLNNSRLI